MKKFLLVFAVLFSLLLITIVAVPVIFKDDISNAIQKELDAALDAELLFDASKVSVSLISSFPQLSVGVGDVGILGKNEFEGDTLFFARQFDLSLDLMSVISGEEIKIESINVVAPLINILVDKEGRANYDIAKSTGEEEAVESTEESPFSIVMKEWSITNGKIAYIDESLPYYLVLEGVDHSGSGDFSQNIFDMISTTEIGSISTGYDGIEYISDKHLLADVTLAMDLDQFKFTFKDNQANLNGFPFSFDGWLSMPASDIDMDISFSGNEVNLKHVLSLTPGDYESYLEGVTAGGTVSFDGLVRGTYNDSEMPAVNMNFDVQEGRISYADYPIPMEEIAVRASFDMPGADLSKASFVVDRFHMLIDGEELGASLLFKDFEDYYWALSVEGNADLEKITRIIPIEGMDLSGKINATLSTEGRMSDLEAERYDKLPTSGSLDIKNFVMISEEMPQGFSIDNMRSSFDPKAIALSQFEGKAGKTDMRLSGKVENYLGFVLGEDELLEGQLDFNSSLVDVNEWMVESAETEVEDSEDTTAMAALRIPQNIDFVMNANIDQLLYDDISLKKFNGRLIIRDGAIDMQNVGFDLLDGHIEMDGNYNSLDHLPTYAYDLDVSDLSIASAFSSFNTVQKLAPFAEKMEGKFSSGFAIAGALDAYMNPVYETINGLGNLNIGNASISDVKLLTAVSNVTSLNADDGQISLKDVILNISIEDGKVNVDPFDLKIAGYTATISGSNTIDGSLDYQMKVKEVPTGGLGKTASSALSSLIGTSSLALDKVDLNLGIGGTFLDPNVGLKGVSPSGSKESVTVKESVANVAKDQVAKQKAMATEKIDAAKTTAVDSAKLVAAQKKKEAEEAAKKEVEAAKEKAKDAVKDLFKKKKKKSGGEK